MKELLKFVNEKNRTIDLEREKINLKIEELYKKIAKLEEKEKKLYNKKIFNYGAIKLLAKKLMKTYDFKGYEIYGPFGLGAETSIYLSLKKKKFDICKDKVYSITLEPCYDGNNLYYEYWTGETTNQYAKGTVGYYNGFNNVYKKLPDSLEEIYKIIMKEV